MTMTLTIWFYCFVTVFIKTIAYFGAIDFQISRFFLRIIPSSCFHLQVPKLHRATASKCSSTPHFVILTPVYALVLSLTCSPKPNHECSLPALLQKHPNWFCRFSTQFSVIPFCIGSEREKSKSEAFLFPMTPSRSFPFSLGRKI